MFLIQLSIGVRVAQLDDGWLVSCHHGHTVSQLESLGSMMVGWHCDIVVRSGLVAGVGVSAEYQHKHNISQQRIDKESMINDDKNKLGSVLYSGSLWCS